MANEMQGKRKPRLSMAKRPTKKKSKRSKTERTMRKRNPRPSPRIVRSGRGLQ
jgi:hypothetical protein